MPSSPTLACSLFSAILLTCPGADAPDNVPDDAALSGGSPRPAPAGPRTRPTSAVRIAAGVAHTCVLRGDTTVACWGTNEHGELGAPVGDTCKIEDLLHGGPAHIYPCSTRPVGPDLTGVQRLAAGGGTTCVVLDDGDVRCWGQNLTALVGDGTTVDRASPVSLSLPAKAVDVVLSDSHACALLRTKQIACWGQGFEGETGVPTRTPTRDEVAKLGVRSVLVQTPTVVPGIDDATSVHVGSGVTCVRRTSGDVTCFGALGLGSDGKSSRIRATVIPELRGASAIFLGHGTNCAQLDALSCWGASARGPLVEPNPNHVGWSTLEPATEITDATRFVLAYGRACAIDPKGTIRCWGYDGSGQSRAKPIPLDLPASELAMGASHVCAIAEGEVWCWGGSGSGQLGRIDPQHTSPLFNEPVRIAL